MPLEGLAAQTTNSFPPSSITFLKDLKQGPYARFKILIDPEGRGKFEAKPREGDVSSRDFQVSLETMQQLFAAFDSAQFLSSEREYESHLKVADMGLKTIILEQKGRSREVRFNYTTDKSMNWIADLFSGLVMTELRLEALENAMKYDKLGLPDQLNYLQRELNNHYLSETQLLIPALRKIANNLSYFNIVQRKAHQLILQIESGKPAGTK